MALLWRDIGDSARVADYGHATLWSVLPSPQIPLMFGPRAILARALRGRRADGDARFGYDGHSRALRRFTLMQRNRYREADVSSRVRIARAPIDSLRRRSYRLRAGVG